MIFNLFRSPKQLSDQELVTRFKKTGKPHFVGELYSRYSQLIASVCLKYLHHMENAEDAAMDVFEIMLSDLPKYEVKNMSNWLFTISKNHCLKLKRLESKMPKSEINDDSFQSFMENSEFDTLSDKEQLEIDINKLEKSLSELNNEQRTCIELFYIKKKSYSEIVSSTGYDMKQVKSHIQNGKRKLKILIEQLEK